MVGGTPTTASAISAHRACRSTSSSWRCFRRGMSTMEESPTDDRANARSSFDDRERRAGSPAFLCTTPDQGPESRRYDVPMTMRARADRARFGWPAVRLFAVLGAASAACAAHKVDRLMQGWHGRQMRELFTTWGPPRY